MKKILTLCRRYPGRLKKGGVVFGWTLLFVLSGVLNVCGAEGLKLEQEVRLSMKNVFLKDVMWAIEHQTKFIFMYNEEDLDKVGKVNVEVRASDIEEILNVCLKGTGLTYVIQDAVIVLKPVIEDKKSKKVRITGKVTDEKKVPLPGVTVLIKGTTLGTATGVDGKYSLSLPDVKNITLVFSFLSMKTQEIKYTGQDTINVVMKEDLQKLEDVVVTGYLKLKKESFTGNATTVTRDQLLKTNNKNVIAALQAFDPSFRIKENKLFGSDPNALPEFTIRGEGSLGMERGLDVEKNRRTQRTALKDNPNLPIFILDGFEVAVQKIYDMDMNRIESMTILKDAAATAMYGSRAANGVVVVTTVPPLPGELRVSYNFTGGAEFPDLSDYNLCNAEEKLVVEKLSGKYIQEDGDPGMQLLKDLAYNDLVNEVRRGVKTDWLAQPLQNVFNHSHSLNVSGGVESIRYGFDLNYGTHNGAMIGSYRDNAGAGLTLDYRNKEWLQIMNSVSFNVTRSQDSPYGSFDTYAKLQPYYAPYSNDGELLVRLKNDEVNPLYKAKRLGSYMGRSRLNDLTNNFSINLTILQGFIFKGQLSLTKTDSETESFEDPKDPSFSTAPTRERGVLSISDDKSFNWNVNAMLYYNRSIGKHFINATAGLNVRETHGKSMSIRYKGFQLSNLHSPTYAAMQDGKASVSSDKSRLLGILASVNYSYNNIYLFDGSFRLDGSSKFGKDKRFAPFWSVGAGMNVHNTKWLKDHWLISTLRVRGTYGVTGNVNFPPYAAISTYKTSDKWYYATPSNTLIALGNPRLTWEKTYTVDFGVNLGLFNERYYLEFSYYRKDTKNQLERLSIRTSSGFSGFYTNAGSVQNKGFEIRVNATVLQTRDWTVALTGTLASNTNRITKLGQEAERYNKNIQDFHNSKNQMGGEGDYKELLYIPLTQYYVGASTTAIYAVPSYGIDPSNGQELFRKRNGRSTYVWDAVDQVVVGDKSPDAQGSFGINIGWKGFYVNTTFLYQWGAQDYNETLIKKVEEADIDGGNVDRRVLTERWKRPGDIAPFFDLKAKKQTQPTSRFVQDNDYVAFSGLSCGYDFNQELIRKFRLTSLGLRFNANDICRWSTIRQERGTSYPYAKNYSFTLTLGF
ncbi:SusC/RagA family TonB-linked outer membrane protein [uncultured Sanguibacteroides sp.]|uniref:SusC/RagA family TonB-linked outer membrane protein n=1 Tax=uncultured Sanguibacteroides sp. TaxID=1635151 RepID=UPI0025F1186B|nr:SusC/RagA family TonB-linked outer membrane protein [uncultured Sanguibacteroides sp.]